MTSSCEPLVDRGDLDVHKFSEIPGISKLFVIKFAAFFVLAQQRFMWAETWHLVHSLPTLIKILHFFL